MNIAGIDYESIKDGEGVRTVIYVSGCSHNCYKCHNPQTHDIDYGVHFSKELQNEIIENIKKRPFISGFTWSGGDPLHENNLKDVLEFTNEFRFLFPEKSIWLYTGYTFEELINPTVRNHESEVRKIILNNIDVLVDGKYVDSQRDITLNLEREFESASN